MTGAARVARAIPRVVALALWAALVACTHIPSLPTGMLQAQVVSQLGTPTARQPLAGGGERLVYSSLPQGREVYHLDFSVDGRLQSSQQVLDFAHLSNAPAAQPTADALRAFYGAPYEITRVASFDGTVWTYRFMDDINLKRLAHLHIDRQGHVAKVMFTDEPTRDDDRAR